MEGRQSMQTLWHMRSLFASGVSGGLSDAQLLDQFSTGHREAAEAAFASLVERHGPMVLRVCQGVLGESHDVQDAFQATFLVLVRKAGSLWVRDSVGPWLHGVALRVASKAKLAAARRKVHERLGGEMALAGKGEREVPDDLAAALHDEVNRLPGKYRALIVLCYLEGLTHEGAAAALGWPLGTVARPAGAVRATCCVRDWSSAVWRLRSDAGRTAVCGRSIGGLVACISGSGRDVADRGAVGGRGAGGRRGSGERQLEDDDHDQIEDGTDSGFTRVLVRSA